MKLNMLFRRGESPEDVAEMIRRDCEKALSAGLDKNHLLFRGGGSPKKRIEKLKTRAIRNPVHSSEVISMAADEGFHKKFGIKFRSRNVVFCTGDDAIAKGYGTTHVVFPVGDFDYCWSPKIRDFYVSLDMEVPRPEFKVNSLDKHGIKIDDDVADDIKSKRIDSYLGWLQAAIVDGTLEYKKNQGLKEATESGCEIMVRCAEYYMISSNDSFLDALLKELFK